MGQAKHKRDRDAAIIQAARENAEKIGASHIFFVIYNKDIAEDWVPVMQMGLAVFLDKPIFFVLPQSAELTIPENLKRLARFYETFDDTLPEDLRKTSFEAATTRVIERARAEGFLDDNVASRA